MSKFEYKAVPAPTRGTKAKGAKSTEDRFAVSITETLNEMAADGWEYVRAETLPCDERKGLTGKQTSYQNILVFKRFLQEAQPLPLDARTTSRPIVEDYAEPEELDADVEDDIDPPRVMAHADEDYAPPLGSPRDN